MMPTEGPSRSASRAAEVLDLAQALADEFKAVHGIAIPPTEAAYRKAAEEHPQSALCLSGGGIRSASFSLGVIQALARKNLLGKFDYLSTVSGGGFAGAWLSALIHEKKGNIGDAQAAVAEEKAPEVRALREYTNYLTPDVGVLSEDSWTGILLWLRNVIINWFGFGPMFLLVVLSAIFYRTSIFVIGIGGAGWALLAVCFALGGAVSLGYATRQACMDLPSHRANREPGGRGHDLDYTATPKILSQIVWPVLAWAFVLPAAVERWLVLRDIRSDILYGSVLYAPTRAALYAVAIAGGYWLAITGGYWAAAVRQQKLAYYRSNFTAWLLATVASTTLLVIGMWLSVMLLPEDRAEFLAVVGPLWLTVTKILQSTAYVALRRETELADLDREWLARLSAAELRWSALWFCITFCCLSLQRIAVPFVLGEPSSIDSAMHHPSWPFWAVPIITFVSGPTAAWLGKQAVSRVEAATTTGAKAVRSLQKVLPILGVLFAAGLLTLLGLLVSIGLGYAQGPEPWPIVMVLMQGVLAIILYRLIAYAMGHINVNRFSMHGVYRNRLTRAFLGAARVARKPDPFTGFDPDDNLYLAELIDAETPRKLFPVINVALNLTASSRAAWAERKAASFTMTPLACGSAALSLRPTLPGHSSQEAEGCFVPSGVYAGREGPDGQTTKPAGMSLASAMTISGAALSPNWGYHSSPVTAFLMTLFNLRLGAWLPNPAVVKDAAEMAQAKPRNAFKPILDDLFGTTSDGTSAIYLSDGGHFDNLGLYEMLRRRCRMILVVDAGEDPACSFEDFGAAIRRASIDLRIHVEFNERMRIAGRGAAVDDGLDFAVATIVYPDRETPGRILYLKPSYLDDIPPDVRAYGAVHPDFPHEPTVEQWFTESQFESYRHLGHHQMRRLIDLLPPGRTSSVGDLFDVAEGEQEGPSRLFALPQQAAAE